MIDGSVESLQGFADLITHTHTHTRARGRRGLAGSFFERQGKASQDLDRRLRGDPAVVLSFDGWLVCACVRALGVLQFGSGVSCLISSEIEMFLFYYWLRVCRRLRDCRKQGVT